MTKAGEGAPDVVVVGAGIVGAACAYELAALGADVLVLERGVVGGGVTAAGMGHLVVMDDTRAEFALSAWSRQLWLDLAPRLEILKTSEPPGRKGGVKVKDVAELVSKLKNEAGVL